MIRSAARTEADLVARRPLRGLRPGVIENSGLTDRFRRNTQTEAIYSEIATIIEADQIRLVISENTHHFRPGSAYAGFLFGTAHDALVALRAI